MVAWEEQIKERSVPAWRDKYVNYALLKRKLERVRHGGHADSTGAMHITTDALSDNERRERQISRGDAEAPLLSQGAVAQQDLLVEEFLKEVDCELDRVGRWYDEKVTSLEHRVRRLDSGRNSTASLGNQMVDTLQVAELHLEAVRLTEFVLLNVEALRKIVKKMDKQCKTSHQNDFVQTKLMRTPLATDSERPFRGERARACRRDLEGLVSPELLKELRNKAIESGGVGLSKLPFEQRRAAISAISALLCFWFSTLSLPQAPKAQRCVGLLVFTVSMWILEAAPFEATAMLVAPLGATLSVMEGSRAEQAKKLLASVFNDSLYLVLSGFVISSIFSSCQLDCHAAAFLQRRLGHQPFLFMLAIMFLGAGLSALVSNVTAPLLLIEVVKPLLRDLPTDSRYSRALLLGLAFSCNIGGMMTPISSPQNIASLQALRETGSDILWSEWLSLSVPFCAIATIVAWTLILAFHTFDLSPDEASRPRRSCSIAAVAFEREELSCGKLAGLAGAAVTLCSFACEHVSMAFGGTSSLALLFVALAIGTGCISRQTFNAYNWHLLFLIGGGSALGLVVRESGLLTILTDLVRRRLATSPWLLVAQLMTLLVAATTFVSHTVAALVLMPLVVSLGHDAGIDRLAVLLGAFACSTACALPMTSFPNVNSLLAVDDVGKPWLSVKHFLMAGIPTTVALALLLITMGYELGELVLG